MSPSCCKLTHSTRRGRWEQCENSVSLRRVENKVRETRKISSVWVALYDTSVVWCFLKDKGSQLCVYMHESKPSSSNMTHCPQRRCEEIHLDLPGWTLRAYRVFHGRQQSGLLSAPCQTDFMHRRTWSRAYGSGWIVVACVCLWGCFVRMHQWLLVCV